MALRFAYPLDWDVLVLLEGPVDAERKRRLRRVLYDLEFDTAEVLSPRICRREEWESELRRSSLLAFDVRQSPDGRRARRRIQHWAPLATESQLSMSSGKREELRQ